MNAIHRIFGIICIIFASYMPVAAQHKEGARSFDFGFEQRVRNEDWNNIFDQNSAASDKRVQVRYRSRAWGKVPLNENIDFYVGLNQETNQIVDPRTPCHFDEVFFESAYFDVKKLFIKGLSLRVGRQNLSKGEGFVLFEGDPMDGSRSLYFNAVDLAYTAKKSRIEVIGISNPAKDRYLPHINDKARSLIDWDDQAMGTYYTDNNLKRTSIEAYYFYKKEVGDRRPVTNIQFQPDRHLHTAGGRVVQKLGRGWEATGEMAFQWGMQHPATEIRGHGGYSYVKKSLTSAWQPSFSLGYFGMSGDNPATANKIEGWDPLFSRWPKWSEFYIYTLSKERGAAYWTNIGFWRAEVLFTPTKKLSGRMTFYKMDSYHPFNGDPHLFSSGTDRGDHYQARLDVNLNKHWKGHALYEHFWPGNFYVHQSSGNFIRVEVLFVLNGSLAM